MPTGLANLHNNAGTFRPYDATRAMGDTAPTSPATPKPAKAKKGCGGLGAILLAVVAVAVTLITRVPIATALNGGAAAAAGSAAAIGGAALAGAAGSLASQGLGLATGLQDKFSFGGLALSAIGAGVGQWLGAVGGLDKIAGSAFLGNVARGLAGGAITQGIGVATGLQKKFGWAGVAAAGVGAGIASAIKLPGNVGRAAANAAGGIAASAAQSLITGKDFGDTLVANLPGIIANTIGNLVASEITQSAQERAMRRAGVERSASAFEERFGDTAEVAAYRAAGLAAARHPGSRGARANFDQAARILLEANSGDSEVAAFLNHIDLDVGPIQLGDIAVMGSRDYLLGSTIDNAGIWVGEKENAFKQGIGQFIQSNPGIGIALTLADGAFAVVAPVKYLGGMALDYFKDEVTGFIADKMTGPRMWSVEKGQAGGSGIVLAGGIALGGLGALKSAGGEGLYRVGLYSEIKGTVPGLDAHHVGQKALMRDLIPGYDPKTAPAILVPMQGHTRLGPDGSGILSRSVQGLTTPRSVLARDIRELRRVYPDIPNAKLQELIRANKSAYPESFVK